MEQRFKRQHRPRRQDSASVWDYSRISEFRDRGFKGSRGATGGMYHWVAVGLVLSFSVGGVSAQLQQKYCSGQNTGEGHYVGCMSPLLTNSTLQLEPEVLTFLRSGSLADARSLQNTLCRICIRGGKRI